MKVRGVRGFTVIEIVVVLVIFGILISLLMSGPIAAARRAGVTWLDGRFLNAPSYVDVSPSQGTFAFQLKTGTGVDVNGRPVNFPAGSAVTNNAVTVTLWRPTPINGAIISLNGIGLPIGATSGTATTDGNGVVTIVVEVDDYESFRLRVTDNVSGEEESTIFIGN